MRLKFWQSEKTAPALAAAAAPAAAARQAPQAEPAPVPGDIDLRLVWSALLRKKAWIIVPTAVVAALSFAVVNVITPRFESEARLAGRRARERLPRRRRTGRQAQGSTRFEQSEPGPDRAVARSRPRGRSQDQLNERPEFDPVLQGLSPLRAMLALLAADPRSADAFGRGARARRLL